jgi:hypothetical protein
MPVTRELSAVRREFDIYFTGMTAIALISIR